MRTRGSESMPGLLPVSFEISCTGDELTLDEVRTVMYNSSSPDTMERDVSQVEVATPTPRPATMQLRSALLADAAALIAAELDRPLQLDDVAHRIATSRRQLQRVYAELANTS